MAQPAPAARVLITTTGEKRLIPITAWLPGRKHWAVGSTRPIQAPPEPDWSQLLPGFRVTAVVSSDGLDFVAVPR